MRATNTPKNLRFHLNGDPVQQPSPHFDKHLVDEHAKCNTTANAEKKSLLQVIREQPNPGDYFSQIYVAYEKSMTETMML